MSVKPIIDHDLKCIYFMIPKNACSSVRNLILQSQRGRKLQYNPTALTRMGKVEYIDLYKFKDYFWFTFLRNPFDRLVSCYNDKVLNKVGGVVYKPLYNPKMSFKEFANNASITDDYRADWHYKSQCYYVGPYMEALDFIGTVENFQEGMKFVKEKLNLPFEISHFRKTEKSDFCDDPNLQSIILRRYQQDYEIIERYTQ